jgi:hypothetical protein
MAECSFADGLFFIFYHIGMAIAKNHAPFLTEENEGSETKGTFPSIPGRGKRGG